MNLKFSTFATAMILASLPTAAFAGTIQYERFDLVDTTPGQDCWQYLYSISNLSFAQGEGFSIFFDSSSYGAIEELSTDETSDWDVITIQSDPLLRSHAIYDGLAIAPSPSLDRLFMVKFIWLGEGTPLDQSYIVYNKMFETTYTGQTVREGETGAVPPVVTIGLAEGDPIIKISGTAGRIYTIWRTTNLQTPWVQIDQQTAPVGGTVEYRDSNVLSERGFYRVEFSLK